MYSLYNFLIGYSGNGTPYPPHTSSHYRQAPHSSYNSSTSHREQRNGFAAPTQHPYTAGLSEDEQYEAAIRASLQEQGGQNNFSGFFYDEMVMIFLSAW